MPGRLCIHVPDQPALLRVFDGAGEWMIGRAEDCALRVDHHSVSRHHAQLSCNAHGDCRIVDLASKNGLRVNGERVEQAALDQAVWFALGDVFCEFIPVAADEVTRLHQRAQTLRDSSLLLMSSLAQQSNSDKLLRDLLAAMLELAECRRGFLVLVAPGGKLQVRAWQAMDPSEIVGRSFSGSRSAIERTLSERRAVYLSDSRDASFLMRQASVIGQGIRALASLPLLHDDDLLGAVYVDTDDAAKVFTELDGDLLQAFVDRAATILAAAKIEAELASIELKLDDPAATSLPSQPGLRARGSAGAPS